MENRDSRLQSLESSISSMSVKKTAAFLGSGPEANLGRGHYDQRSMALSNCVADARVTPYLNNVSPDFDPSRDVSSRHIDDVH